MAKKLKWVTGRWLGLAAITAAIAVVPMQMAAQKKSDTIILHARIYTVSEKQPWAEALAILGDKIVAIGSEKEVAAYRSSSTHVIDAGGRLLLPGFEDCHIHFMDGSMGLTGSGRPADWAMDLE